MKSRWMIMLLVISVGAVFSPAQENGTVSSAEGPIANLARQRSNSTTNALVQLQPSASTQDDQTYPARLEAVVGAMSTELGEIAQAAREGKISRDQAEYLSLERYYVALTRFQLLRMLYQSTELSDPPQMSSQAYSQANTASPTPDGSLFIPPVTCSPDIPSQLVDYLQLTPLEVQKLQQEVLQECKQVEPLVEQLDNSRRKLMSMKLKGAAGEKEIQAAAAEQAEMMKQLIVMNSQLQSKLYSLLTTEQQQKVDGLVRSALASGDNSPLPQ